MKYFIANWKANKNLKETQFWVQEFLRNIDGNSQLNKQLEDDLIKVIICAPSPLLHPLKQMFGTRKNLTVGSQDISIFEGGTYTGEVSAHTLQSLAEYVIIGHSERKKFFHETEEDVNKKYFIAKQNGIEPIYCVAATYYSYPPSLNFICYEPPEAISKGDGRGNFESSANILAAKQKLKVPSSKKFIYGGSVNRDNITDYIGHKEIDGYLVGGASLDPIHFIDIIRSSL